MKNITRNIIFGLGVFAFLFVGSPILAEENANNEKTLRERMDMLKEKVDELAELVREMEEEGKLPVIETEEEVKEYDVYLGDYIRYGEDNDPQEVEKLQTFLNEYEEENIPVTGFYGEITLEAVKRFQAKYADEILAPWGIDEPTGYVYKTTQRLINDIKNPDVTIPMPELVPDTADEEGVIGEVMGEDIEDVDVVVDDEDTEDAEEDEDMEYMEEVEEEREEREENDTLAWVIIVLGSIGLGITFYNIYSLKKDQERK